ncbi:MAG TPA: ATP-binding protein, partial [Burkholderiaceae bacterium]
DAAAVLQALALSPSCCPAGESPAAAGSVALDGGRFDASMHRSGEHLVVEFEPASAEGGTRSAIYGLARRFVPQLQQARSVDELCRLATRELKRLTGFGRCLAYRFDDEGDGEVLAEALDEGYDSYAGHRFPAGDVPPQARALYCVNYVRVIPDACHEPVPLLAVGAAGAAAGIDLSMSHLRSVSPVHLEYMRNMGTRASMSVSIVARGRLWGLVSCHDHEARHLGFATRAACEHLGRLLSLQVEATEQHAEVAQRLELRQLVLQLMSRTGLAGRLIPPRGAGRATGTPLGALMSGSPELDASLLGLVDEPVPLLRMTRAGGAAVVLNDECRSVGETPPAADILTLARRIVAGGEECFATDHLAGLYPDAAAWGPACAGVLALSISQVNRHLILWFRPAVTRTIRWAGEPAKAVREDGRIHPRRSFRNWQQAVEGRSLPWTQAELAAARELRQSLVGIVLRRAEELAEVATELGRVNKELEAFSYTVSHDLRAPMRHISGYVDLVLDIDGAALGERARRYLAHVKDASSYAGQLVDGLLDFSRMGRAALKRTRVDTDTLCAELVREFRRQHPGRAIEWSVEPGLPRFEADALLIQIALRNLVANAVKYTRDRDPAHIAIRAVRRPGADGLEVADDGVGFDMRYAGKLFGVFQRLHQSEEFEGTGIGLASVRRIVERHGGEVWAEGAPDEGARFGFAIPRATEKD